MLAEKIETYRETGEFISVTPAMYRQEYPHLKELDRLALANVQLNLQSAAGNNTPPTISMDKSAADVQ